MARGITTIMFDVFNTLVHNSPELWPVTFGEICHAQGIAMPSEDLLRQWWEVEQEFRRTRLDLERPENSPPFKTYEEAWRDSFQRVFDRHGIAGDAAAAARACVHALRQREPFPEAAEALLRTQERYRIAIVSNADDAFLYPVVELFQARGVRFHAVLSSEAARAYKPHPGIFARALAMLDASPGETAYVGDAQFEDVYGGRRAGLRTVWLNRSGAPPHPDLPQPHHQIASLAELLEALEGVTEPSP